MWKGTNEQMKLVEWIKKNLPPKRPLDVKVRADAESYSQGWNDYRIYMKDLLDQLLTDKSK